MRNPAAEVVQSVRTLFALLDPASRRRLRLLLGLGVVNMMIEMGAVLGFVVLLFQLTGSEGAPPGAAAALPDLPFGTPTLILAILVAYTVKNLLRLGEIYAREEVGERVGSHYAQLLFRRYLDAPFLLHLRRESAEMVDTVWNTSDHTLRESIRSFQALAADALMAAGIFVVLLRASPGIAFLVGAALGAASLLLLALMHRHFSRIGSDFRALDVEAYATLRQSFRGIREVKLFQKEDAFAGRFTTLRDRLRTLRVSDGVYAYVPTVLLEMAFIASFAGLALYAWFAVDRSWLLPLVGTYAFCGARLLPAANRMVDAVNRLRSTGPLLAFLQRELRETEGSGETVAQSEDAGDAGPGPVQRLEATGIGFAYPGRGDFRVDDVSFQLEGGASYAILGESGSGKTTLLHLLAGLLSPEAGSFRLNGGAFDVAGAAWRRRVGYVAQEPFVLSDSLRANVVLERDGAADPERLDRVLGQAQLSEWVAGLPDGIETAVGEGGREISGGQRQRIAIARALYREPSILLFDEPTSALDTGTERALEDALLHMEAGVTRVIVTHRLATARRCDGVLFLEDGRLVAQGPWEELLATSEAFRRFVEGD